MEGNDDRVFIAWRVLSRRTADLAKELGLKLKVFKDDPPYLKAYYDTKNYVRIARPNVVFAQLPQGPLLYLLAKLKKEINFFLVVDVHTAFLVYDSWKGWILNWPFKKYLNHADLILVHNESVLDLLPTHLKRKAIVLYDPMPRIDAATGTQLGDSIVFPASWHKDEPIEFVLEEYIKSETPFKIIITGKPKRNEIVRKYSVTGKVVFSGYLPDSQYFDLLAKARCVIAATTREYTMLSAVWEALSLDKPLIVSKTRTLYKILGSGPEYFIVGAHGTLTRVFNKLHDEAYLSDLTYRISSLKRNLQEKIHVQFRRLKELLGNIN